jgi:hypothetical protein
MKGRFLESRLFFIFDSVMDNKLENSFQCLIIPFQIWHMKKLKEDDIEKKTKFHK